MIPRLLATLMGILAAFAYFPHTAHAQTPETLVSAGTTILGAITVKKIFSDIQQTLDQAQKGFESSGNRLLGSGVEQSYAMLQQLEQSLNDDLTKTFNQISDQRKLAILDLYKVSHNLENKTANDFAADIVQEDKAIAEVRFLGKDVKFLIVRVTPSMFEKTGISSTPIAIYGVGFGTDDANKKFTTTVLLAGQTISSADIETKEWGIQVNFGHLDPKLLFKEADYNHVPMIITSTITETGGRWCAWAGCQRKEQYSATYHVDFYPTNPANLTVKQEGEELVANGQQEVATYVLDLPDMNNAHHDATTSTPPIFSGTGWRWDHEDPSHFGCANAGSINGCPFAHPQPSHIFNDSTQIQWSINNSGGPVHYTLAAVKKQYEKKAKPFDDVQFTLTPGQSQHVQIAKASVSAWIEGVLPTGQKIGPINLKPPGGLATDPIVCISAGDVGDKSVFDCQMQSID
jgi:hypothetical protein